MNIKKVLSLTRIAEPISHSWLRIRQLSNEIPKRFSTSYPQCNQRRPESCARCKTFATLSSLFSPPCLNWVYVSLPIIRSHHQPKHHPFLMLNPQRRSHTCIGQISIASQLCRLLINTGARLQNLAPSAVSIQTRLLSQNGCSSVCCMVAGGEGMLQRPFTFSLCPFQYWLCGIELIRF